MKTLHQTYTLNNGVKLPKIGYGTWQIPNGEPAYKAVLLALKNGYRHIDTAADYGNEESVGKAVRDSNISRKKIFVTSKLKSHIKTYEGAMEAFEKTLNTMGLDYLDLYLIHGPRPFDNPNANSDKGNVAAYRAMEKLYKDGRIRAIGVSNFEISDIENILNNCDVTPAVNQIGYFIGLDNDEIQDYCESIGIQITSFSPLAIGYALSNETIRKMAEKYNVTPAQICIRYDIQKNTAPLPKSTHESRIIENSQVDFTISEGDMEILNNIRMDPRQFD